MEPVLTRDEIVHQLKDKTGVVTFTKKDGTTRVMYCTLMETLITSSAMNDLAKRVPNPDVVSAWDLEKSAWRSFRVDSVQKINYY